MPKKEEKRKPIKAIFIDAVKEEVREITLNYGGVYWEMYRLMDIDGLRKVSSINVVRLDDESHYIHVDGEGLLKDPEHFILWKGYQQPLAGHAIIYRVDDEGNAASVRISVEAVRRHLKFVKLKMHGYVQKSESAVIFDRPGIRHTTIPVFTERREPGTGKPLDIAEIAEHLGVPPEQLQWSALPEDDDESEQDQEPPPAV